MSEQEKNSRQKIGGEPSVVVVKQQPSAESRLKPIRPTEPPAESAERLHKRAKAPVTPRSPSVAEEIKDVSYDTVPIGAGVKQDEKPERKIQEHAVTEEIKDVSYDAVPIDVKQDEKPERKKQEHVSTAISKEQASKLLSTSSHVPEINKPLENIVLATMEVEPILKVIPSQPIPAEIKPVASGDSVAAAKSVEKEPDEQSITEDITELPNIETCRIADWSDEQEAGGLPRSESRSSRVSRAVRQLFCCGVAYAPASEDDISSARVGSGI